MKVSAARNYRRKLTSDVMLVIAALASILAVVPLVWILVYVVQRGASALNLDFFTQLPTPVGVPGGGVLNGIVGSAITIGLATLISAPFGILAAFYAATHPNNALGLGIRFGTDVISGVPSIVMGLFAYTIIVLPMKRFSALSGGLALSFIMLPIIIRTTEEMLRLVPGGLREGSLALGAPEWRTSMNVVLQAAWNGVLTGIMLAIARAAGEAAPMLFTSFGNPFLSTSLDQPIATLPHTIYVYANSPYNDWHQKAWATALVLIALVFGLNVLARLTTWWRASTLGSVTGR